jgi:uncharacterized membrane protein
MQEREAMDMNRINKAITINAPIHPVFQYIREPVNLPTLCAQLIALEDIQQLPNGGRSFKWEYKLVNVHFFGTSTTTVYDADHRLTSSIQGGITGNITWLFEADDEFTHVTLIAEYALPDHFVQKHGVNAISSETEAAISGVLQNLKANLEKMAGLKR